MTLTSTSTLDDALAQYNDNLAWDGDITKAGLALEALRWIFMNRPQIIASTDRTVNFESLLTEKIRLEKFVAMVGPSVTRASFVRGRMLT